MKNLVPTFEDFLNEAAKNRPDTISFQEINNFVKNNDKVWILVGGSPAAGKSYVVNKYLNLPVIDMDDYVEKLSGGKGKYDQKLGAKARVLARQDVDKNFKTGKSFIKQGVSANLQPVINQCKQAKEAGYICIFLYVDVSFEQAQKNNLKRVSSGARELSVPDYKIKRKRKDSIEVFKTVKKTSDLFDYFVYYKNVYA